MHLNLTSKRRQARASRDEAEQLAQIRHLLQQLTPPAESTNRLPGEGVIGKIAPALTERQLNSGGPE